MKHFTEEERIQRVWDKEEAKAVLFRNMYYMAGNQRETALDTLWVKEPENAKTASYGKNWGYYTGMDEIRRYYVDNNPFGAKGTMNCHPVATIRVEEAEDGKTILCQWYNASYETRMVDGKLTPLWICEKGNATDLQVEAGQLYGDQPVDLPDEENPVAVEFGKPTLPMEAYITRYNYYPYPAIPEPYETYRPELGCGPEGNPKYQA